MAVSKYPPARVYLVVVCRSEKSKVVVVDVVIVVVVVVRGRLPALILVGQEAEEEMSVLPASSFPL